MSKPNNRYEHIPNSKYEHIVLWGRYLGSADYYINDQILLAAKDKAPENAIYKDNDGKWHTFDDVVNPRTLAWFKQMLEKSKND